MSATKSRSDSHTLLDSIGELADHIPVALFVKDSESRILLMNRACEEQWGVPFTDLQGTDGSHFFPIEQMKRFRARDQEAFQNRKHINFEETFRHVRHRDSRIVYTYKKPIYDADGKPLLLICISVDITDRKRQEAELKSSDDKLRRLFELSPLGIVLTDMSGKFIEFNEAFQRICGYSAQELSSLDYWALTPKEYSRQEAEQLGYLLTIGVYGPYEKEYIRKDGTRIPLYLNGVLLRGADGNAYIWSIVEDITERKRIEESMQLASLIYESSDAAILVTDEQNRIVDANPAFFSLTGYNLAEIKGSDPKIMRSGLHDENFYRHLWKGVLEHGEWQGEVWDRKKDGSLICKWLHIHVIRRSDGSIHRHVAQFLDITEKKEKDDIIWHQANFDSLTGLPNRRLFRDRLEQELKKSHSAGIPLALLFIDLDRFKDVNDTLGHDKGDALLIEAARRICRCVRETDTVARLGGDEFTVIIPELGNHVNAETVAQCIIKALSEPYNLGGDHSYLSASIGIATHPFDATDVEGMLKNADRAMYQAKDHGRNRFAYFTESMQRQAEEKIALTNDLRHALERNELAVHYQPIVDLSTGGIVKAEALLRWTHPSRGAISPATFIPLAEESGLILELGDWVFSEAIATINRLRRNLGRLIQISVNKSPAQFLDDSIQKTWPQKILDLGLPGNSVTVEITEGMLIKDHPKVNKRLLEFRNMGIEVSIDDFGTGFSSLSYLKQFDIDYLKIDRSFVSNLNDGSTDMALAEAIIVMAHKLGIKTIAEGIETEAQQNRLIQFGCDYGQGYLYSPPITAEAFEKMLQQEEP